MAVKRYDRLSKKEIEGIQKMIVDGYTFKQVANKFNIEIGNVTKVAKQIGYVRPKNVKVEEVVKEKPVKKKQEQVVEKKKCERINDDKRMEIALALERLGNTGSFNKEAFLKDYDISYSTLLRIAKQYNVAIPKASKNTCEEMCQEEYIEEVMVSAPILDMDELNEMQLEEEANKLIKKDTIGTKTVTRGFLTLNVVECLEKTVVRAGLIDDRHDIPCLLFVYRNSITPDIMFSYGALEMEAERFIRQHIPFDKNDMPEKRLKLYVTGLSAALSSVIKVCYNLKVNLSLMHYDTKLKTYHEQVIFDDLSLTAKSKGTDDSIHPIYKALSSDIKVDGIYTYNCDLKDIINDDDFYIVKRFEYPSKYEQVPSRIECFIVNKDLQNVWPLFAQLTQELDIDQSISGKIAAYKCRIGDAGIDYTFVSDYKSNWVFKRS